jgi:hypothetical protein
VRPVLGSVEDRNDSAFQGLMAVGPPCSADSLGDQVCEVEPARGESTSPDSPLPWYQLHHDNTVVTVESTSSTLREPSTDFRHAALVDSAYEIN